MPDEWISTREAADLLGISAKTVQRELGDDNAYREQQWGQRDVDWRTKPVTRVIFQVTQGAVERRRQWRKPTT